MKECFGNRFVDSHDNACRYSFMDGCHFMAICGIDCQRSFGGTGMNILNPALTMGPFAFFVSNLYVWKQDLGFGSFNLDCSGETILGTLAAGGNINYGFLEIFQDPFDSNC